jgi:hypothetical protein
MVRALLARWVEWRRGGADERDQPAATDADSDDTDSAEERESASEGDAGSGSIWDLIPAWQYDGRHVESGGQTRDEQERALEDVQRQAEEIERSQQQTEPRSDS